MNAFEPPPSDSGPPDQTLGGYLDTHNRPPAFEGSDGSPYTVSLEIEPTGDLRAPFAGYLVFPRWAHTGVGIVSHVESDTLARGGDRENVDRKLRALTLAQVKNALEDALTNRAGTPDPPSRKE